MKREMLLHELHPSVVHAPLALLPTAAVADLVAVLTWDRGWARSGRQLWAAGALSALFAGTAGLAASQEVRAEQPRARDMVFLHGLGNALVTTTAVGMALWRRGHRPTLLSAGLGLAACTFALYTAALGGKMVYELGVGINPMPADAANGTARGPLLLSREAPAALLRDAFKGLRWVLGRARALVKGEEPLARGAEGVRTPEEPPHMPSAVVSERIHLPGRP